MTGVSTSTARHSPARSRESPTAKPFETRGTTSSSITSGPQVPRLKAWAWLLVSFTTMVTPIVPAAGSTL
jgi:hypothetical protein